MAANIEIEIKISVDDDAFFKVKQKLNSIAKFVKRTHQIDKYFTPAWRDFMEHEFPFEWLSIRKRSDEAFVNYKHWYPENAETATHCDEFETQIEEPDQMEKIFSALDFRKLVTVEKEREVYVYNEEIEVAFDKVNELGHFIEIEALEVLGDVEATREKLFKFARYLGIDVSRADKRGYPFMLMKKKGVIKQ